MLEDNFNYIFKEKTNVQNKVYVCKHVHKVVNAL